MSVINQFQHIHHAMNRMFHARQGIIDKAVNKAQRTLLAKIRTSLLDVQHKTAWLDQQALLDNFNMMGIWRNMYRICAFNH